MSTSGSNRTGGEAGLTHDIGPHADADPSRKRNKSDWEPPVVAQAI
jgi:hypothetical protein